jgi:hypothetical protein
MSRGLDLIALLILIAPAGCGGGTDSDPSGPSVEIREPVFTSVDRTDGKLLAEPVGPEDFQHKGLEDWRMEVVNRRIDALEEFEKERELDQAGVGEDGQK